MNPDASCRFCDGTGVVTFAQVRQRENEDNGWHAVNAEIGGSGG